MDWLGRAMGVVIAIILWMLCGLAVLVFLVLLVPFHVKARGRIGNDMLTGEARASWGFGLVKIRVSSDGRAGLWLFGFRIPGFIARGLEKIQNRLVDKSTKSTGGSGIKRIWYYRRESLYALRLVLHSLHLRGGVWGVLGLSDPADTAYLEMGLRFVADRLTGLDWDIRVEYLHEAWDLEGFVQARIWPAEFVVVVVKLCCEKQIRQMLVGLLRTGKEV